MTSEVTNKTLTPKRAIIVYQDKSGYKYFLESREIKREGDRYSLMTAIPLANDVMKQMAMSYMKSASQKIDFGGLISEHLLYGDNKPGMTIVMWYRPTMKKILHFSASLKIKSDAEVQLPPTLYLVINQELYIFAMMDSKRPDLKTKLYNAPFFNTYENGKICLGSAKIGKMKADTFEGEADRFERAFYMAEQTHTSSGTICKTPLTKLWPALLKSKTPFPVKKELLPHKNYKSLGDLINKLIMKNHNTDYGNYEEED